MKKTLFLTAFFTSLLIGFTACSDAEDHYEDNIVDPTLYNIIGK